MASEPLILVLTLELPRDAFPDPLPAADVDLLQLALDYLNRSETITTSPLHCFVERQTWRLHVPGWEATRPHRLVLKRVNADGTATAVGREESDELLDSGAPHLETLEAE